MTRDEALTLLHEHTKGEGLRKHALAVEASMRAMAQAHDGDQETWGVVGLLHDFDYEAHPTMEEHPLVGVEILRGMGVSEEILTAILGHGNHTGVPRETPMARALFAVDELCGLITAVALVRPSKSIHDVKAKSVLKKMKDKAFARSVNRDDIRSGAEEMGLELRDHIAFVVEAMRGVAADIGLEGESPPP
jgi:putative nucleotidyltransferase with HDIG domain